jgi:hypothetical protein
MPQSAETIAANIADVSRWSEFKGYKILPGIASAVYEKRTDDMVGSRLRVRNTDGSTHVEEIVIWDLPDQIVMRIGDFSPPLNRLASHFIEEWRFSAEDNVTMTTRSFQLYPKNVLTRPLLRLIGWFFKRAIAVHLAEMRREAESETEA